MRETIEALGDKDDCESHGQEGQTADMAQTEIMGEEIAHDGAEYAGASQRTSKAPPRGRQVSSVHVNLPC